MKQYRFSLLLLFLFFLSTATPAWANNGGCVNVTLTDGAGSPLPNVKIRLFFYERTSEYVVQEVLIGRCRTNDDGRCSISFQEGPQDASGFYRGYLKIGLYGQKSLLWPGGQLEANVWLNTAGEVHSSREDKPYDWQEPGKETVSVDAQAREGVGRLVAVIVILGGWLAFMLLRRKQ